MRSAEHQRRIDQINQWVNEYKAGDVEAGNKLIKQFEPFLAKQCNRWGRIYKGVHPWEHQMQEAQVIFFNLLNEYTVGGPAYFNVFIERKLPLRLRYFFIKEIKRRTKDLSHSDDMMLEEGLLGHSDDMEELITDLDNDDRLKDIYEALRNPDVLTDRERDMVIRHVIHNESHTSIAASYGLSRSRVSRIITNAIDKLRGEVRWR
jgi:RNA polymerase sigma factor (sigma-70 family)